MTEPAVTTVSRTGADDLVDLLDRVVDGGAVVNGGVIISLAGVDLIRLDVNLMLIAVERLAGYAEEHR